MNSQKIGFKRISWHGTAHTTPLLFITTEQTTRFCTKTFLRGRKRSRSGGNGWFDCVWLNCNNHFTFVDCTQIEPHFPLQSPLTCSQIQNIFNLTPIHIRARGIEFSNFIFNVMAEVSKIDQVPFIQTLFVLWTTLFSTTTFTAILF